MADNIDKPNVKDQSTEPTFNEKYLNFLRDIRTKAGVDTEDKSTWRAKMVIAMNQRLGVKRYTNFPYPGAPDIPLPETDKLIKKSVPNLVLSAWSPKKMCRVAVQEGVQETPELTAKAKKSEAAMNMFLRAPAMDLFRKLMLAADNRKQNGHCIFKVSEKFECIPVTKTLDVVDMDEIDRGLLKKSKRPEKEAYFMDKWGLDPEDKDQKKLLDDAIKQLDSGADVVEITMNEYKSRPMIDVVDGVCISVPSYTKDINSAVRIKEDFFLPRHEVEQYMDDGIFLEKDLEKIPYFNAGDDDLLEATKSRNEGVTDNTSRTDVYHMEMICCWFRLDDKDKFVRKIFTFFADCGDPELALAQDIDFPFSFPGWQYEKDDNEIKDSRYYNSRGEPEMIRAMQEIMERCINNKIIRDEMSNTPMWEVLDTSQIMDAHHRMIPGAKLPVRQLGTEIKQLSDYPKPDPNSTEIMSILKAYTEEYRSVSDQLFRNSTNAGGGKTLGEINVGIQQNSGPLNLEVISWNETLSRVYMKIFLILQERMEDSIWVDGQEVTKEDFNFPADVRSNGDLEVANEQMATTKAFNRLSTIMNPTLADVVNSEDRYNALKDWLEKDGVKDPDLFCTNPVEIAKQMITQLQQQIAQMRQQLEGMKKETEKTQQDAASSKRTKGKADAEAKEAQSFADETNIQSAESLGTAVGEAIGAGGPQ